MKGRRTAAWMVLAALGATSGPSAAQERSDSAEIAELRVRIDALTRELERLQLGGDVVVADSSVLGFGPAASRVYRVQRGVSLGGYGEVLYENFAAERQDGSPSGSSDRLDALRAIAYLGYKFNDRFLFNSEIEFEHASSSRGGSVSVEFAYLDFLVSDGWGVRAGLLLSPMGFINELHEPPVFLGARRPLTETVIIPSTWRTNGVGVFGSSEALAYRAYVVTALDGVGGGSSRAGGFSASGLRGGRQNGARELAEDLAFVGRLDYTGTLGLLVGASAYVGQSAHNRLLGEEKIGGTTLIWDVHAEYRAKGIDARVLVAGARVGDAADLDALRGLEGAESIGEALSGWYGQLGYDVLRGTGSIHQLTPYVIYERVNTQAEVPAGFAANPANDQALFTAGIAWKPLPQIAAKADFRRNANEAHTGVDQFSVALGYLF